MVSTPCAYARTISTLACSTVSRLVIRFFYPSWSPNTLLIKSSMEYQRKRCEALPVCGLRGTATVDENERKSTGVDHLPLESCKSEWFLDLLIHLFNR